MVTGEASAGKAWSLWKAQRPVWLPVSPQVIQPLHFSQNDGLTGRSVATPGITSDGGGKVELPSGGAGSGGLLTLCCTGGNSGGRSRSWSRSALTGVAGVTRPAGPPGRNTACRSGGGGGRAASGAASGAWPRAVTVRCEARTTARSGSAASGTGRPSEATGVTGRATVEATTGAEGVCATGRQTS